MFNSSGEISLENSESKMKIGRLIVRALDLPPDVGLLIPKKLRVKLTIMLFGLVMVAGLDMLGVVAMLPLMGIFTGMDRESGTLGFAARVLGGDPSDLELTMLVAGFAVSVFVLKGMAIICFRWWQMGVLTRQQAETSITLLQGYLLAPYTMHLKRSSSELMRSLSTSVALAYGAVINGSLSLAAELITIACVAGLLIVLNPFVALCAVIYLGATAALIQLLIRPRVTRLGLATTKFAQISLQSVMHALGAVKEVKLRNNPRPFVEAYRAARMGEANASRGFAFLNEIPKYLMEIIFLLGIALLAAGLFLTSSIGDALPMLALFGAAGFRILPSVVRAISSASAIRFGRSGIYQAVEELTLLRGYEADGSIAPAVSDPPQGRMVGDLQLERVSFGYDNDNLVLRNVDFTVPRGTSVALIGSSGAGKSTLVDLILGLQKPSAGRICCGGIDIHARIIDWQDEIAIVPQDVFLLDASIRRNIGFDVPANEMDEERLLEAVERAQLMDFIRDTPEGLDLIVGDRGVRLSGGQRQRIGIARALYRRPEVLVLDEATSALDNETERKITATIDALHGKMTVVVVAHRLTTVRGCDQFVVLNRGEVEARGSFDEAIAGSPEFARLVDLASIGIRE